MSDQSRMVEVDYFPITETAGDDVSQEQYERICHRYYWAEKYCVRKQVLEVACGTGQGLGYLSKFSNRLSSGDYSSDILKIAKAHYKNRMSFSRFDAQFLPYRDNLFDVVILFEAIYYLPSAERFVSECRRVLRKDGIVLIATANKDLYDFNPSPYSHQYYGVVELEALFSKKGFSVECFGNTPIDRNVPLRQHISRPLKKLAVKTGLMPKTAHGKKFFKKIVFGQLVTMPAEIEAHMIPYQDPVQLPLGCSDSIYKVIYCAAKLA